jgi:integrase
LNAWKPIGRLTKDDLVKYFNLKEWKEKSDSTTNLHKTIVKSFFKDSGKPGSVEWIKLKNIKETISPEQTLTAEDINKLLEIADNHYDKALIAFLYDTGCRISEAQRIKWKDLRDTTDGIIVSIPTKKTGAGYRKVILPFASQYLRNLQIYAYGKPEDCIFHLAYRAHSKRIQKIREKSGIGKPFTCHKLRHAQATQLVRDGVQEAIIRKKLGWSPTSTMIARYQHNTDEDVINATLEVQGKAKKHHEPIEINQPEKLSITDAAGHLFKLDEENSALKAEMERMKGQMETYQAQVVEAINKLDPEEMLRKYLKENNLDNHGNPKEAQGKPQDERTENQEKIAGVILEHE